MYATLKTWLYFKTTSNLLILGEKRMKKLLLALLLSLAGVSYAVDTPTNTPTVTLTPTATRTNTPVVGFVDGVGHIEIIPGDLTQADGVSGITQTAALPGSSLVTMAQSQSFTAAQFSTGTATARFQVVVPADYQREFSLYLYASCTSTSGISFQADVSKVSLSSLTSSASVFVGPVTNVSTQFRAPIYGSRMSRVFVPLSGTVGLNNRIKPGDLLNVQITKSGLSAPLNLYMTEVEYKVNAPLRP